MGSLTRTFRNGVDTDKMFATLDLIEAEPELAKFQFRAANRWLSGAHNRSTIRGFFGGGAEDTTRTGEFELDAESELTGDMDVRGALGISGEVRNGFQRIGARFAHRVPLAVDVTSG